MKPGIVLSGLLLAAALTGCVDNNRNNVVAPHLPPAAPRGLSVVNGDGQATLYWLGNTEGDVVAYRIYKAPCASGSSCPYDRIASTGASATSYTATGLPNGVTQYFAIAAVNSAGAESDLSYETLFDTPRPAGTNASIANFRGGNALGAAWDFSAAVAVSAGSGSADILYSDTLGYQEAYAADNVTDVQDAGYHDSMDEVAWAPTTGWSPTGTVQLVPGHVYIVWTRDNTYAKFKVRSLTHTALTFDWAYQTDPGNLQLRAKHPGHDGASGRLAAVSTR